MTMADGARRKRSAPSKAFTKPPFMYHQQIYQFHARACASLRARVRTARASAERRLSFRHASVVGRILQNFCRRIGSLSLVLACCSVFPLPALASPQATNLKDLPEDARASITKELARKNNQQDAHASETSDDGGARAGRSNKNGCRMDVGSQNQSSSAPRRVVTVVTGPLVQICK